MNTNATPFNAFSHPVPSWIPPAAWSNYLTMRQTIPVMALKSPAAIKGLIDQLDQLRQEGCDLEAVITKSVRHQWTGFCSDKQLSPALGISGIPATTAA